MTNSRREPSHQAQVAKLCRQYVKSKGIKCSATSESFAGGTSVRIAMTDVSPTLFREIESHCSQYQYGHFNGMEDIYEHSNYRDDIPQTKYLFVENSYSQELRQAAWDKIRTTHGDLKDAPADLQEINNVRLGNEWVTDRIYRSLRNDQDFWDSLQDEKQAA